MWLFRGDSHRKLERLTKASIWVHDQVAPFYDRSTAVGLDRQGDGLSPDAPARPRAPAAGNPRGRALRGPLAYRIVDASAGPIATGTLAIADLRARQPWALPR